MKKCSTCKEIKPLSSFSKDGSRKSGIAYSCKDCINEMSKRHYENNRDKCKDKNARWRIENPERAREMARRWRISNPDKAAAAQRRSDQKRYHTANGKLSRLMSVRMYDCLIRGVKDSRHWELLAGYSVDELKSHLERLFNPGMTWENYGSHWHIDHIIPIAAFNYEKPEDVDFRRCWSLSNLQPLEAYINRSKGAKIGFSR